MTHQPPDWMVEEAERNPIVAAYLKHGRILGFGPELFELMARELAASNALLQEQLLKAVNEQPPPVVILKGAVQ